MSAKAARARAAKVSAASLRNLIPGGVGGATMTINAAGVAESTFLIAKVYDQFERGLLQSHVRRTQTLYAIAEDRFRADIRRPDSRGDRPGGGRMGRQTGRFTFGSGQTFQAVLIHDPESHQFGIGFPKLSVADARTDYVWRSLEFGLGPKGTPDPMGPLGEHKLPSRFHFQGDRLVLGRDPKDRFRQQQNRKTKVRRANSERLGQGFEGKFFIRDSMEVFAGTLPREYRTVFAQTFGSL